jgi:hypothetical protein
MKIRQRSATGILSFSILLVSVITWVAWAESNLPLAQASLSGYHIIVLVLIIATSATFIVLIMLTGLVLIQHTFVRKLLLEAKRLFASGFCGYLVYGAFAGSYLLLSSGGFAVVVGAINPNKFSIVYNLFISTLPLLTLWFILSGGIFFLLTLILAWELSLPDLSVKVSQLVESKLFAIFWITSSLILSVVHWLSMIFRWDIRAYLPLWYWRTTTKIGLNTWLIIPLSLLFFAGYWLISSKKLPAYAKTLIVLLTGYLLIIGFAAIEGSPYQVLYEKRYISGHRNYIAVAARNEGGTEFLYDYEIALGHDRFFATKPPGIYLTYRGLLALGSLVFPHGTYEEKYDAINHTLMLLFPLIALSSTLVLEKLTLNFTGIDPPQLPGYLLIIVPNFLLLQGTIDQAIIPLLFLVGLWLGTIALQRSSWILSILFGSFIYLALYFSFSLLPLVMLFGLWIVFELWRNWKSFDLISHIKFALGALIGFGVFFILLYLTFNYSPWVRYQNAMVIHEIQRLQPASVSDYLAMYLLNNLEFASWIGIPLMLTSAFAVIRSSINLLWGRWKKIDSLVMSFLLTYAFLNHFSRTLSEVARLWLFLVPSMCIFAIHFIQEKMKKNAYIALLLSSQ